MAKLGSKKNPLILRVCDDTKVDDIAELCHENGWHFILGLEPDEEEDLTDLEKKLSPFVPYQTDKTGRNEPCPCGSSKKFKKCCAGTA